MNALNAEASVQRVIVLNLRTEDARIPNVPGDNQRNKYIAINQRLTQYDASPAYPKLQVWDWNSTATSLNCGTGDDSCFQADGISPRVNNNPGAQAYANFIKFALDNTPGTPTNPVDPLPAGNRCLPGNGAGFAPWSYVGLAPNYPPLPPAPQTAEVARFRSIDPVRLLDTRVGDGDAANRMLIGGRLLRLRVVGDNLPGGTVVPPSAASVSLNVTVAGACAVGLRRGVPVRAYRAPGRLQPQLPTWSDRAQRRHDPDRHPGPRLPLHQRTDRPRRRHQRLLRQQPQRGQRLGPRRHPAGAHRRHPARHELARSRQGEGQRQHLTAGEPGRPRCRPRGHHRRGAERDIHRVGGTRLPDGVPRDGCWLHRPTASPRTSTTSQVRTWPTTWRSACPATARSACTP